GAQRWGDVYDPNTGERQAVAMATSDDADAAVAAASDAWREWRETSLSERTRILFRFRERFEASRDELRETISWGGFWLGPTLSDRVTTAEQRGVGLGLRTTDGRDTP
ncbi:MAG: aldehyde dehydrogenase family protein, partial [Nitriliruptorales bacterium]|nr:aldehyde dehydrogenase family protein [Nitriliruptorales bacterium]